MIFAAVARLGERPYVLAARATCFRNYWSSEILILAILLGLHLDPGVVAQDEVHLKPRGRSPVAEWLTGDVIPVRDELVHEIGLNPLAELGCPGAELAALERGGHASIEEVELRRGERLAP